MAETIRLAFPDVGDEELRAVEEVLRSGYLTMGPKVEELEGLVAEACGVAHAAAVSSGTAALHLALAALEIGPGDEVIVPAYTFPATANVVALVGATPKLVDVDPVSMNLREDAVAAAIGPRTRAVLAVHLFGNPVDWDELERAVPEGVTLIEDAAGALGASYRGRPCGSLGVLGCLSFHPRKIVTTGEGGAVTTDDADLADAVRRLRHHGIDSRGAFDIPSPATNYRLSDVLCAIGIPQLRRLRELHERRAAIAHGYLGRLHEVVEVPAAGEQAVHGWQAYVVQLDRRDEAIAALRERGIEAQIGTYALHHLSAYRDAGDFPGADSVYRRALALPFHSRLTDADLDRVAETIEPFHL